MNTFSSLYSNTFHYNNPMRDRYGRDRYYNSYNDQIFSPVLSEQILSRGFQPYYPNGKKFAVCISHDIDHLYVHSTKKRKLVNLAGSLVRARLGKAYRDTKALFKEPIFPNYDLEKLLKINNGFDLRSSYYFLSLEPGDEDFNYHIQNIKGQLSLVNENNCEIGLHGGHRAYNDFTKLMSEKERLENTLKTTVTGYRNHYLRFQMPLSWENLLKAGFTYDTTFGYADCSGFRNGMCYPFYPYNPTENKFIEIVELPLIMMDATLFYYMRFDEAGALAICKQMAEKVRACGGIFTLLWHNNFLTGEMGNTYRKILELLTSLDPWFATSAEAVEWWRKEKLLEKSHNIIGELIN